ncbi:MAG TPA: ABC transporter substrate-binding protein [Candidatus Binatia bacterium]
MRTILGLLIALAVSPVFAAEPPGKIPRVGLVSSSGDARAPGPLVEAFRQRVKELGYIEGKNISFEFRYAEGKLDRVPGLVDELVRLNVDALVVSSVPAIRAAKRAAAAVPVVMLISVDPVPLGIVESLARPGGNITGIASLNRDLRKEGLELLKETLPGLARVAVLWNVEGRASSSSFKEYQAAAGGKPQLQSLEVRGPTPDLEGAFEAAVKGRAGALIAVSNPVLARYPKEIAALALKNRLPSMSERGGYAAAGGLMDYSPDYLDNFRRLAVYVDKILKGARPGDLAIEKTKFHLAVNLKTARQLGLAVPSDVSKRADKVIK